MDRVGCEYQKREVYQNNNNKKRKYIGEIKDGYEIDTKFPILRRRRTKEMDEISQWSFHLFIHTYI